MFTKESSVKAVHKRWRNERGIKLVVSIKPFKKESLATALLEGKTYVAKGKDNNEALRRLMELLIKECALDKA